MINSRLRMQILTTVALAGIALIVACNNGGAGGSGNAGNNGDVLAVGNIGGEVNAVSADGLVVVGAANVVGSSSEAFRWTEAGGLELLGDLPGGDFFSVAEGVSADGGAVVGYSHSDLSSEGFQWFESSGLMFPLGSIPDSPASSAFSRALAVSADGFEVVGTSSFSSEVADQSRAVADKLFESGRHSFRSRFLSFAIRSDAGGDLPFGDVDAEATAFFTHAAITGGIVVGTGVSHTLTQSPDPKFFPWHKEAYFIRNDTFTPIGDLAGGFVLPGPFTCASPPCFASGIPLTNPTRAAACPDCSVDGEVAHDIDSFANDVFVRRADTLFRTIVVVGASYRDNLSSSRPEAFRWQESRNFLVQGVDFRCAQDALLLGAAPFDKLCMQGLGDLPGGLKFSEATAISGFDPNLNQFLVGPTSEGGIVIVGYGHTSEGRRAFRWENTNIDLDAFPVEPAPVDPKSPWDEVNEPNRRIFFCDLDPTMPTPCMLELGDFLDSLPNNKYEAFDRGDWIFVEATDISDLGNVIVGNGINPSGEEEGFVIILTDLR